MMFVLFDLDLARVAESLALVAAYSGYFDTDQAGPRSRSPTTAPTTSPPCWRR
ncbi:MAG: hypothetical protein HS111_13200 [Kofleriaceae bacterium]|nr:hypothetical protein [Kofleriaceae bacterium]